MCATRQLVPPLLQEHSSGQFSKSLVRTHQRHLNQEKKQSTKTEHVEYKWSTQQVIKIGYRCEANVLKCSNHQLAYLLIIRVSTNASLTAMPCWHINCSWLKCTGTSTYNLFYSITYSSTHPLTVMPCSGYSGCITSVTSTT